MRRIHGGLEELTCTSCKRSVYLDGNGPWRRRATCPHRGCNRALVITETIGGGHALESATSFVARREQSAPTLGRCVWERRAEAVALGLLWTSIPATAAMLLVDASIVERTVMLAGALAFGAAMFLGSFAVLGLLRLWDAAASHHRRRGRLARSLFRIPRAELASRPRFGFRDPAAC